jgi:lipoprotein-anchoring transpeptidase ErfK/SrfK
MGCSGAHPTGAEVLTATVTNTGPTAMSNRTATLALAAAALMMIGSTASAGAREVVRYTSEVQPGTIVVKTAERKLYLVLGGGEAIRYTVAVGRPGKQWQGQARVSGKFVQPAWTPPAEVKADNPALPDVIPGGAPNNPMGVAAMTLSGGEYAIHGTNRPESIGKFASYGCIRMLNQDITDLFERVDVGAQVVVMR